MTKLKYGPITNQAGDTEWIDVKYDFKTKDLIIGFGLVTLGVLHLIHSSFKAGSDSYEQAELETMKKLNIID